MDTLIRNITVTKCVSLWLTHVIQLAWFGD